MIPHDFHPVMQQHYHNLQANATSLAARKHQRDSRDYHASITNQPNDYAHSRQNHHGGGLLLRLSRSTASSHSLSDQHAEEEQAIVEAIKRAKASWQDSIYGQLIAGVLERGQLSEVRQLIKELADQAIDAPKGLERIVGSEAVAILKSLSS